MTFAHSDTTPIAPIDLSIWETLVVKSALQNLRIKRPTVGEWSSTSLKRQRGLNRIPRLLPDLESTGLLVPLYALIHTGHYC